jgi:hypothetical protein
MAHPVLITSHFQNGQYEHYAWSPQFYDPNVGGHPLLHPDYQNFLVRVQNNIINEQFPDLYHTHTDFHCNTLLNNRGETVYIALSYDHVVSPVYFNIFDMNAHVMNNPSHNRICVVRHRYI